MIKVFIYELWLLTICVCNNKVMVYMKEYMCGSTTYMLTFESVLLRFELLDVISDIIDIVASMYGG